jgi:hypothetical protein
VVRAVIFDESSAIELFALAAADDRPMISFPTLFKYDSVSTALLFAPCQQLVRSLVSSSVNGAAAGDYLDLRQAEQLFGIDREILLAATIDRQLPSTLTDSGCQIAYRDLERFVDRYFYSKNPISGSYLPKLEG